MKQPLSLMEGTMPTIGAFRSAPSSATCSRPGIGIGTSDSKHQPRELLNGSCT